MKVDDKPLELVLIGLGSAIALVTGDIAFNARDVVCGLILLILLIAYVPRQRVAHSGWLSFAYGAVWASCVILPAGPLIDQLAELDRSTVGREAFGNVWIFVSWAILAAMAGTFARVGSGNHSV